MLLFKEVRDRKLTSDMLEKGVDFKGCGVVIVQDDAYIYKLAEAGNIDDIEVFYINYGSAKALPEYMGKFSNLKAIFVRDSFKNTNPYEAELEQRGINVFTRSNFTDKIPRWVSLVDGEYTLKVESTVYADQFLLFEEGVLTLQGRDAESHRVILEGASLSDAIGMLNQPLNVCVSEQVEILAPYVVKVIVKNVDEYTQPINWSSFTQLTELKVKIAEWVDCEELPPSLTHVEAEHTLLKNIDVLLSSRNFESFVFKEGVSAQSTRLFNNDLAQPLPDAGGTIQPTLIKKLQSLSTRG